MARLIPHRSDGPARSGGYEAITASVVTLAAGNPLRGAICLMCPDLIGDRSAHLVTVVSLGRPPGGDGRAPAVTWLCHITCLPVRDRDLIAASRDRIARSGRRRHLEET